MPLSSGPTLFLAPSPIAWQARHLLNEVLPAVASCACAPDAAAMAAMTIRALEVGLFMGALHLWRTAVRDCLWHGGLGMDKPRNLDAVPDVRSFPLPQAAPRASIGFTQPTQARPD